MGSSSQSARQKKKKEIKKNEDEDEGGGGERKEVFFLHSRYLSPLKLENNGGEVSRFHAYPDSNRSAGMERIVRTQSNSF